MSHTLLRSRRPAIRNGDVVTPGDQIGRAVVAIDDALDQRRPVMVGERDLDCLGQLFAIGHAQAFSAAIIGEESIHQTRIIDIDRMSTGEGDIGPVEEQAKAVNKFAHKNGVFSRSKNSVEEDMACVRPGRKGDVEFRCVVPAGWRRTSLSREASFGVAEVPKSVVTW